MPLSEAEKRALDEDGYLVLPGLLPPDLLARLRDRVARLFAEEGEAAGSEFKKEPGCRRLANLADKGDAFRELIAHPRALECVRHVLGPDIKLSSLNARSAGPGGGAQPLHADMAAVADERGYWVCNALWLLDDYTPDNGALRVVPGPSPAPDRGGPPAGRPAPPAAAAPSGASRAPRAGRRCPVCSRPAATARCRPSSPARRPPPPCRRAAAGRRRGRPSGRSGWTA